MGAEEVPERQLGYGETAPYDKAEMIILDGSPRTKRSASGFNIETVRAQQLTHVHKVFTKCFKAKVKCIRFDQGKTSSDVEKYFQNKFAPRTNTTTKKLHVIYFNGCGGNRGKNYVWRFMGEGSMSEEFKAYKIIDAIIKSGTDALIILDCYIPDKFQDKWKAGSGTVRIMARGEELQDTNGQKMAGADFTTAMVKSVDEFVQVFCKTWEKPATLGQVMRPDQIRAAKTKVLTISGYVAPGDRIPGKAYPQVRQFVMMPKLVRETGKIVWYYKVIQAAQSGEGQDLMSELLTTHYFEPEDQIEDNEMFMPPCDDDDDDEEYSDETGDKDSRMEE